MAKRTTSDGYMAKPMVAERRKPEFSISEKDLPAIKEWKVGGKYSMELEVEMVSSSKGSDYDSMISSKGGNKEIHNGRFRIISIDSEPEADLKKAGK